jgi:hypothetical protein
LVALLAWQLWRGPYKIGLSALGIYDGEARSLDLSEEEPENKPNDYRFRKRDKLAGKR